MLLSGGDLFAIFVFESGIFIKTAVLNHAMNAETITISREEYEYLKRLEQAAQDELLHTVTRGLEDAARSRIRQR